MECLARQRGMSIIFFLSFVIKKEIYLTRHYSVKCTLYLFQPVCVGCAAAAAVGCEHTDKDISTSPQCCCPMAVAVVVTYHVHVLPVG